jgi:hypothetical protein
MTKLQGFHATTCGGSDRLLESDGIIPVGGDAIEANWKLNIRLH